MVGVLPELIISRSSKEAVVVQSHEYSTRLTGLTDYGIFSVKDQGRDCMFICYLTRNTFTDSKKDKLSRLATLNDARRVILGAPVLFLEAKNKQANLKEGLCQVIAESVAG